MVLSIAAARFADPEMNLEAAKKVNVSTPTISKFSIHSNTTISASEEEFTSQSTVGAAYFA